MLPVMLRNTLLMWVLLIAFTLHGQPPQNGTIAQYWNEACLTAISRDFARPTVHARNLFHTSVAIYEAWAAYDPTAEPYLLGRTVGTYTSPFSGVDIPESPEQLAASRAEAISFAAYRLIRHRFQNSPGSFLTLQDINQRMVALGYDFSNTSTDYLNGGPAELGNYIAQQMINFGFTDGSNESDNYANTHYEPVNQNILPEEPGTNNVQDPNRWQAVSLSVAIDQSGNLVSDPPHLSPEWGNVVPFSLTDDDKTIYQRDGHNWNVYLDPGPPVLLDTTSSEGLESDWKWGFIMVSVWQSHLDPEDETMIDASPASIGNIEWYPESPAEYDQFYDFINGGTAESGHSINPITGQPYAPQIVKRSDYGRIVAEFWADGPNSYTPPGHWFHIYNQIRHHEMWQNKWQGEGEELDPLEYDVKAYLTLGGAMHDAAISAWSVKGYYDYVRPVSAIRYMCEKGQCSDPMAASYHPAGAPLIPGLVELVHEGDPLAGDENENVGKIKLFTWRGPDYIDNPETDYAGVGWILGENWWPYQRPTFVTPPFAGYVSGHSTYSRTAAEVLTLMTGDPYFPGGMSNFYAPQNEFLEFEVGPTEDLFLQWATYTDASDQCSLSRIWGGIHPPVDDVPGRFIGMQLGPKAFQKANQLFNADRPVVANLILSQNKIGIDDIGSNFTATVVYDRPMNTAITPAISFLVNDPILLSALTVEDVSWITPTEYQITYHVSPSLIEMPNIMMRIADARDANGQVQNVTLRARPFLLDTRRPLLSASATTAAIVNDDVANQEGLALTLTFDEPCDESFTPMVSFEPSSAEALLVYQPEMSTWASSSTFVASFNALDTDTEIDEIQVLLSNVKDLVGNDLLPVDSVISFAIDTRNPIFGAVSTNNADLNILSAGANALTLSITFDEAMNTESGSFSFSENESLSAVLVPNLTATGWQDAFTYTAVYNQTTAEVEFFDIDLSLNGFLDLAGNNPDLTVQNNFLNIDTRRPQVMALSESNAFIADDDINEGGFELIVSFDEAMSQDQLLLLQLDGPPETAASISYNPFESSWLNESSYRAAFELSDEGVELENIHLQISFGADLAGNNQSAFELEDWLGVDTKNPEVEALFANTYNISDIHTGEGGFSVLILFSEAMNTALPLSVIFGNAIGLEEVLQPNMVLSGWQNAFSYKAVFDVNEVVYSAADLSLEVASAQDLAGNLANGFTENAFFDVNLNPLAAIGTSAGITGIYCYPNPLPAGESIQLHVNREVKDVQVRLFDLHGRLVHELYIPHLYHGEHLITPPALSAGMYQLQLSNDHFDFTHKLVVTH